MQTFKNFNYALFGNPINHSKSPLIHKLFKKQTHILHIYKAVNIPLNQFSLLVYNFFKNNLKGANVTAPFKEEAYFFSNKLTERAKIAHSVNTLKKIDNTTILGDNTDGIGLLSDLQRINFIKKGFSILIIGAGGAVKGILFSILSLNCTVYILNRTLSNAKRLVEQFSKYGNIYIFEKNNFKENYFNLVINAVSRNVVKEDFVPLSVLSDQTFFYDMNYDVVDTPFISWSAKIGSKLISNGIGMLVFQAAYSFLEWHNIFPKTDYIIDILNKKQS
ncbi:shikimate dehydrogenase [Buchnera aphidicola (Melanaphis sacchari)]|uniref:Shikimate dehydrogenase (NADP(+)) n=1 Tax=Buchnera aphidicola (Melanaphis sacchari) TaxID=2173854 RepID=A0A2U8DG70_9GAMM|nr:shikimate dehydrogenase [Buchnera aphidicola]AWH90322.1 shikimate dehydrogenase [Buchnera aphidicola (Melanaphis sacchari)]